MYKVPDWVWNRYKPVKVTKRDTSNYDIKLERASQTYEKESKNEDCQISMFDDNGQLIRSNEVHRINWQGVLQE